MSEKATRFFFFFFVVVEPVDVGLEDFASFREEPNVILFVSQDSR